MLRHAMQGHQISKRLHHVPCCKAAAHHDGQALPRVLVDDVEHPELAPVMGTVLNKVIRPDMVAPFWPQTDAGSICQPEAASLGLLLWHFEPLPAPDPLHPLLVHPPADLPQQGGDPPVAIAAILTSQVDDGSGELLLMIRDLGNTALGGPGLADDAAGPALGHAQSLADLIDHLSAPGGACYFPRMASWRMSLSSVRSEMALRRRVFSVSSSLSRLA